MKAIVYHTYGSPDVLQLEEVEKPTPRDDEVLIKVSAAAANAADWHLMRGAPFLVRLSAGLRTPKDPRLGADFAGRVEAVGNHVSQFQPGDEVFGGLFGSGGGAFAEYVCARENALALKPANVTYEEAAAVPLAGITALQGLREKGQIKRGQKVLINGASGGVGTFAVQIAKAFAAEVTGVCSTRNVEMVRSIGADHVIDYTQEDFTNTGQHYDLIYDAVGNRSVSYYKRALNPNGTCAIAGFTNLPRLFEHMVLGPLRSKTGNKKVGLMGTVKMNQKDLVDLKELLESEKSHAVDR
jgi:NADPH:quinone reductase-like Zn-dependent oxidoreductase